MIRHWLHTIPAETKIIPAAHSFHLEGLSEMPAVLLLHGFTGQTSEMRYLGDALNARGLTVFAPRLPGHGTNSEDFRRTSWRDWLRRAIDAYYELRNERREIMVAGLSMGGLLATIVASQFPVSRVALLAPAFATVNPIVRYTPVLRYVVPPYPVRDPELHDDPDQQHLADHYWNTRWPGQIASLARLMSIGRKALPRVTAPTLTVISRNDRTVPVTVAKIVERRISASETRILTLTDSGHVVTSGIEKETVAAAVSSWFTGSARA